MMMIHNWVIFEIHDSCRSYRQYGQHSNSDIDNNTIFPLTDGACILTVHSAAPLNCVLLTPCGQIFGIGTVYCFHAYQAKLLYLGYH